MFFRGRWWTEDKHLSFGLTNAIQQFWEFKSSEIVTVVRCHKELTKQACLLSKHQTLYLNAAQTGTLTFFHVTTPSPSLGIRAPYHNIQCPSQSSLGFYLRAPFLTSLRCSALNGLRFSLAAV